MPTQLHRWNRPGDVHFWTISCYRRLSFFYHDDLKAVAIAALDHLRQAFGIGLVGYVIMPNHVHVLLYPHVRAAETLVDISVLLHAFKQESGYYGKEALRRLWKKFGRLWSAQLNQWALGRFSKQDFWNPRGYDFNVLRRETLREKLYYLHLNPVRKKLVDHPGKWAWSSYRFYEEEKSDIKLAMDWDGSWPIRW